MVIGNSINESTTGICGFTGTAFTATPVTAHAVQVGGSTSSTLTNLGVGTNGQFLIGSTGADPTFATPTSTGGNYIAGAGTSLYIPANYQPGFSNLGFSYSGSTFTVNGFNGTALSATNPAYVTVQSKATPGRTVTIPITANQNFIDASGASEITGNLFGFFTSVAITVDVPFFVYAVLNTAENDIQFMLSRYPHKTTSAATIGKPGSAIADAEGDFWAFDNITVANYASNPCICVGSLRMRMSASDDWTVQTLAISDGAGQYNENTTFSVPLGQFNAISGTLTRGNGGTAAVFTTTTSAYNVYKAGFVIYHIFLNGDGGTDGSGASLAQFSCPYLVPGTASYNTFGSGATSFAGGNQVCMSVSGTGTPNMLSAYVSTGLLNWGVFTNGNRSLSASITYPLS